MLIKREHDKINFLEIFDFGKELYKNLPPVKKRRRRKLTARFIKYFFIIFLAFVIIFFGWNFFVAKNIEPTVQDIIPAETGAIQDDNLTISFLSSLPAAVRPKISKSFEYSIDQDVNGFFSLLKLNYAYPETSNDGQKTYQDKVSIYAPLGSILTGADGFKDGIVTSMVKNNRTVFAGEIIVRQGEIANARLSYKLPDKNFEIGKCRGYQLKVQNSQTDQLDPLAVNLRFKKNIKDFLPSGFNVYSDANSVRWETDLSAKMEFIVDFY